MLLGSYLISNGQEERRLAMVIGNADYSIGELKNPVNDALLMAKAFDSLGFDVILDTNIQTKQQFEHLIREFDRRRENYDVGFVYYAGHGIQVGSNNYMIPTQEKLEKEDDVYYSGVNVQMIIRILTRTSDQVNVLILDACRNNPFEQKWNRTRSIYSSKGLAKMQAPMGSLIAFATTAGNVAPDGDGENSVYCTALWNNMFKERVSLDQFFRNVRAEVLQRTDGQQQTEESTQLTGETFYLVQSDYKRKYSAIDSLIIEEKYFKALDLLQEILYESAEKEAILLKSMIYNIIELYDKEIEHLEEYQLIFPEWIELHEIRAARYEDLGNFTAAKKIYKNIIEIDSTHSDAQVNLAICYEYLNELDSAIEAYTIAIELDTVKTEYLSFRSDSYLMKGDTIKALEDLGRALQINDTTWTAYSRIAELYVAMNQMDKANETYQGLIASDNAPIFELSHALNNQALILENLGKPEDAVKNLTYIIDNFKDTLSDDAIATTYRNLGDIYSNKLSQPIKAIENYKKSIELEPWGGTYKNLVSVFLSVGDTIEALSVSDELLNIDRNPYNLSDKADILFDYNEFSKALELYHESNSNVSNAYDDNILINWNTYKIAQCLWIQSKPLKAINQINENLKLDGVLLDSVGVADLLKIKSAILSEAGNINDASQCLQEALKYNQSTELYIHLVYFYWENHDTLGVRSALSSGLEVAEDRIDTLDLLETILQIEIEWKEWNQAEKLAENLMLLSQNYEYYCYSGKIAMNQGKYEDALELLSHAMELDSSSVDAFFIRSKVWMAIKNDAEAVLDLERAISIDADDPEGYYYLAKFFLQKGEFLKALKYLNLSIARYRNDYFISDEDATQTIELYTLYQERAECYRILGDNDLMCDDLKSAIELGAIINLDACIF